MARVNKKLLRVDSCPPKNSSGWVGWAKYLRVGSNLGSSFDLTHPYCNLDHCNWLNCTAECDDIGNNKCAIKCGTTKSIAIKIQCNQGTYKLNI